MTCERSPLLWVSAGRRMEVRARYDKGISMVGRVVRLAGHLEIEFGTNEDVMRWQVGR